MLPAPTKPMKRRIDRGSHCHIVSWRRGVALVTTCGAPSLNALPLMNWVDAYKGKTCGNYDLYSTTGYSRFRQRLSVRSIWEIPSQRHGIRFWMCWYVRPVGSGPPWAFKHQPLLWPLPRANKRTWAKAQTPTAVAKPVAWWLHRAQA